MRASRQAIAAGALGLAGLLLLARSSSLASGASLARPQKQAASVWDTAALVADEAMGQFEAVASSMADAAASIASGLPSDTGAVPNIQDAVEGFRASTGGPGTLSLSRPAAHGRSEALLPAPCLVRRWSAIWLVHPNRTRSYVRLPTLRCDDRATPVTASKLELLPLATGSYTLSAEESEAACKASGCPEAATAPPRTAAQLATSSPAVSDGPTRAAISSPAVAAPTTAVAGGAQRTDSTTPEWMHRATLRFNDAAVASLSKRRPGENFSLYITRFKYRLC